ncbi:adenylate/guanylate cyclase domain-containing protein [Thermoproteota archaeon]
MHRQFRSLLENAKGTSEFVIVINLDIRGFSSFSLNVESPEVALFIKKVYLKLIDEYFSNASFFKPTGDGLLMIIPYTEDNLRSVATESINVCLKTLDDFQNFCANDPMISFEVPTKLGIGLSKGTVCCLAGEGKTLDYSGRVLNLASRLMDVARPSGIVFDEKFRIDLLPQKIREKFSKDKIYLRGIAEEEPINIFFTKEFTKISPSYHRPILEQDWEVIQLKKTLRVLRRLSKFQHDLPSKPFDTKKINVTMTFQSIKNGRILRGMESVRDHPWFKYGEDAGNPYLDIEFTELVSYLDEIGAKDNWPIKINIKYMKI